MGDTSGITIRLIGVVAVDAGDRVVDPRVVGGPRCAEVLAYLAVHRHRDVGTDELADLLWSGPRPRSWNSSLRGVISKIRDALAAAGMSGVSVRSRGGNVRLVLPDDITVDLELVRSLCRFSGDDHRATALDARRAHGLLTPEVLIGIDGDWAEPIRIECESLRLRALDVDATCSLEIGEYENAVSAAEAILSADPLREIAYRLAMRGYVELGDRAQALAVGARCRRILADVLGVGPSPETEQLYAEILRADAEAAAEPTRRDVAVPANPRDTTYPWLRVVGRTQQLDAIEDAIAAAGRGHGQFVVLRGESGSGKSFLGAEVVRRAREAGVRVLVGRCSEDAIIPYEPFVEAFTRELDAADTADARQWLTRHGTDILRLVPHASRRFGDLMPAPVPDDRSLVMEAVAGWLTTAGPTRPTLMFVDDAQWASVPTLTVLRYLVASSAQAPLCVIVTSRSDFPDHPELIAAAHEAEMAGRLTRLEVTALTVEQVTELVELCGFDIDPVALHARSNGLPMFVASLLAAHWRLPGEALPSSVADAVAQLERRLTPDADQLLRLCAVIGMTVQRPVLRAAATHLRDDTAFASALDELIERRFLLTGDTDPEGVMRLRHPLVQEALYATTPGALRAQLHSAVGRALESLGATTDTDDLARLTRHFSRALDGDRPAAAVYARRAAETAYAVAAYEDAIVHFRDTLAKMVPRGDTHDRCRVLIGLGRSLRRIQDPSARQTLIDAVAMAQRLGDVDLQVEAALANVLEGIMFVQLHGVDHERVDNLHDALAALESTGRPDGGDTAHLLAQLVTELSWENDWQTRRAYVERGAAAARAVGDRRALAAVMQSVLIGLRVPECGDLRELARTELADLMSSSAYRLREPSLAIWMARTEVEHGDIPAATRLLEGISAAQIQRGPELAALVEYGRVGIDQAAGRLAESEARIAALNALPDLPSDTGKWGRLQLSQLAVRTLRGDFSEQAAQRDRFVEWFDLLPVYRPMLALALADVGEIDEARRLVEWFTPERVAAIPTSIMSAIYLSTLARAAATVGDADVCRAVHDRLLPFADQTVMVWSGVFGVIHHHLAHVMLAVGEFDRAAAHLDDARREHRRRGYAGWSAETEYLGLALDLATTGQVDPVRRRAAEELADQTGATAVRRRIDALMSTQRRPDPVTTTSTSTGARSV